MFIMLFQFIFPMGQVTFAGSPKSIPYLETYEDGKGNLVGGKGTQQEPYESRLWPDASHADYKHRGTSQFKIKLSDG